MKLGRVGSSPVVVPEGVTVDILEGKAVVNAKGSSHDFVIPPDLYVELEEGALVLKPGARFQEKVVKAKQEKRLATLAGLCRSSLNNLIRGLVEPFVKKLVIVGVGYRAHINDTGYLTVAIGYSHLIKYKIPESVEISCPKQTEITVQSFNKQLLGSVVADICRFRKYNPYKGKGIMLAGKKMLRKEASKK